MRRLPTALLAVVAAAGLGGSASASSITIRTGDNFIVTGTEIVCGVRNVPEPAVECVEADRGLPGSYGFILSERQVFVVEYDRALRPVRILYRRQHQGAPTSRRRYVSTSTRTVGVGSWVFVRNTQIECRIVHTGVTGVACRELRGGWPGSYWTWISEKYIMVQRENNSGGSRTVLFRLQHV